jgi:hypothetical protein
LETLYATQKLQSELTELVKNSAADLPKYTNAINAVEKLEQNHKSQLATVKKVLDFSKNLRNYTPIDKLSGVRSILVASYGLASAYIILYGADCLDSPNLTLVDLVKGIDQLVRAELDISQQPQNS